MNKRYDASHAYVASVPGSIMLTGEHAVLYGAPALVAAINKRIQVSLIPRQDTQINIHAPGFGNYSTSTEHLNVEPPFTFVLACFKAWLNQLPCGADVEIKSEFEPTLGLGSSAAVTVAMQSVLHQWTQTLFSAHDIYTQALSIIHAVQGMGSGADIAASVYGGVVYYQCKPKMITPHIINLPVSLIYSGSKMATAKVVAQVNQNYQAAPKKYQELFAQIGDCTKNALQAIKCEEWMKLGKIFSAHYAIQCELGVSNEILDAIVQQAESMPNITGAKISGSGLGDCVVTVGHIPSDTFGSHAILQHAGVCIIPIEISPVGMCNE